MPLMKEYLESFQFQKLLTKTVLQNQDSIAINEYKSSIALITQYMPNKLNDIPISPFNKLGKEILYFFVLPEIVFLLLYDMISYETLEQPFSDISKSWIKDLF